VISRASPSGRAALRAADVRKRYGTVPALDGASLTVERGTCVALVGESGSGKTTLLRCFNRMVEVDGGRIEVRGEDVRGANPVELRRSIGYVQQDGGLLPHWTLARNVALVPWLLGRDEAEAVAREKLDLVGLPPSEFADRIPAALSGGQRQRAALARALAAEPAVLLLDEPFGALDALTRAEVQETFVSLRARLDVTVLLVTHDLDEAFRLADSVAVMRSGRIERAAAPDELRTDPGTPYVDALLRKARVV